MKVENNEKILVTGCAGFIGMHLVKKLCDQGFNVIGIDNLNDYYDINLKKNRLLELGKYKNFDFFKLDICDYQSLEDLFNAHQFDKVVNLAAQAGVRYSLINPNAYIDSNISGFMNVLECCRHFKVKGLVYASSSSVYGGNKEIPFSEKHNVDSPISIYAASKKANELMAFSYSHLYDLSSTGLRFFTVYGPWGRPDMAMFIFAEKILNGLPIPVFNNGDMLRDFTYISDITDGILSAIEKNYKCEIFNLGNNKSESLMEIVAQIESGLSKKAIIRKEPIQPGDIERTCADIDKAKSRLGFDPKVDIKDGINNFINWYLNYIKRY